MKLRRYLLLLTLLIFAFSCSKNKCRKCKEESESIIIMSGFVKTLDMQTSGKLSIFEEKEFDQIVITRGPTAHSEAINRGVLDNHWEVYFKQCLKDGCDDLDAVIALEDISRISAITLSSDGQIIGDSLPLSFDKLTLNHTGSGSINFATIQVDSLIINHSGSGVLNLDGSGDVVQINQSGSGNITLQDYVAKHVDINLSGSGSSFVAVSDSISVNLSGSGNIQYIGNPKTSFTVTGSGEVIKE